eukprot:scaffold3460_cov93-Skeletonema_dohrnii-CCMP3373.AAC.3
MHDGVEIVGRWAFSRCISLRKIKLLGVREVEREAFYNCTSLNVEFGGKLEIIRSGAFGFGPSLQKIKLPSVRTVEEGAFGGCRQLTDVVFGGNLETIQNHAFHSCPLLRRIAVPLKDDMIPINTTNHRCSQFDHCRNLITLDLVGGIHKTISSLFLESWRTEIIAEIDRINQDLPSTGHLGKTDAIRGWIRTVIDRVEHYKAEHYRLLKEDMTLLELAVWKAKIDEKEDDYFNKKVQAKKAKIDVESARKEQRIKSDYNNNFSADKSATQLNTLRNVLVDTTLLLKLPNETPPSISLLPTPLALLCIVINTIGWYVPYNDHSISPSLQYNVPEWNCSTRTFLTAA